ncbi:hypothetical protein M427DRAFT_58992 [Gonapodya prolifera JEL478]|uniref:Extracellular membrane protein CFEM domain-containing protein n=1 Tax=Gonapodya prolifera (strain JEL478) TaxID=1344416 RepID=A0A139A8Q7_GONPJ|nr:hypothetical protein M427DRAFT_58992 [Gonapodya prolifera JEL478]|eukprot:KXS13094.1 hypothetical protein M427DRAFT_58992 [Gonapodya prolifera JEL478]
MVSLTVVRGLIGMLVLQLAVNTAFGIPSGHRLERRHPCTNDTTCGTANTALHEVERFCGQSGVCHVLCAEGFWECYYNFCSNITCSAATPLSGQGPLYGADGQVLASSTVAARATSSSTTTASVAGPSSATSTLPPTSTVAAPTVVPSVIIPASGASSAGQSAANGQLLATRTGAGGLSAGAIGAIGLVVAAVIIGIVGGVAYFNRKKSGRVNRIERPQAGR